MIHSLRARLFAGLTLMILATAGSAGYFTYRWAFDEAIEAQDSILAQIGAVALNATFRNDMPLRGVDAEAQVVVEEMGSVPRGSTEDRLLWSLQDGLHVASRGGQPWRVMLQTRPDGSRFAVGQPTLIRNEIASGTALRTLLPLAALIPCLMVMIAFVIAQSLRPMVQLAALLDNRRADDLEKLPIKTVPNELHPFVASINRLLDRVQMMLDQQRRFIADAAHELRTPITALSLQAENLDQVDLPEQGRVRLAVLKEGTRRTKHLLDQLLSLARFDINRSLTSLPVTSLEHCAKDVVADLLPEARHRGIDLGFQIIGSASTRGEPVMLAALIRNLIQNALRYTPPGGRIDVGVYREAEQVILQIEDTGPGILPSDLDRIFEPFVRGSRPADDGTGLGLSIVKRIVDRLAGSVALENVSGAQSSGLRAIVRLPATDDIKG
jgi:two-component system, OmpR family, sensor kinase